MTKQRGRKRAGVVRHDPVPPHARILDMSYTNLVVQRALYAAAKLGVADVLKRATRTSDEIAQATEAHPGSMYRLLRALASLGLVTETAGRRFRLTPLGAALRSDVPGSMRGWVIFSGEPFYLRPWEEILHSIRTGTPAWDRVHGAPVFDYFARNPEAARIFDEAMTSLSVWEARAIVKAYDFSRAGTVIDVGGGHGMLLATILAAYPKLRGVLHDQSHVVAGARKRIEEQGLASRVTISEGSFFDSVPGGGDAYLLKYIIHDWDDEKALTILRNCRRAMSADARLLIVETPVAPPGKEDYAKLADLEMLVLLGSRERTLREYGDLLARAGFRRTRVIPTQEALSIIEAAPV